jgi:hypothetical protein
MALRAKIAFSQPQAASHIHVLRAVLIRVFPKRVSVYFIPCSIDDAFSTNRFFDVIGLPLQCIAYQH